MGTANLERDRCRKRAATVSDVVPADLLRALHREVNGLRTGGRDVRSAGTSGGIRGEGTLQPPPSPSKSSCKLPRGHASDDRCNDRNGDGVSDQDSVSSVPRYRGKLAKEEGGDECGAGAPKKGTAVASSAVVFSMNPKELLIAYRTAWTAGAEASHSASLPPLKRRGRSSAAEGGKAAAAGNVTEGETIRSVPLKKRRGGPCEVAKVAGESSFFSAPAVEPEVATTTAAKATRRTVTSAAAIEPAKAATAAAAEAARQAAAAEAARQAAIAAKAAQLRPRERLKQARKSKAEAGRAAAAKRAAPGGSKAQAAPFATVPAPVTVSDVAAAAAAVLAAAAAETASREAAQGGMSAEEVSAAYSAIWGVSGGRRKDTGRCKRRRESSPRPSPPPLRPSPSHVDLEELSKASSEAAGLRPPISWLKRTSAAPPQAKPTNSTSKQQKKKHIVAASTVAAAPTAATAAVAPARKNTMPATALAAASAIADVVTATANTRTRKKAKSATAVAAQTAAAVSRADTAAAVSLASVQATMSAAELSAPYRTAWGDTGCTLDRRSKKSLLLQRQPHQATATEAGRKPNAAAEAAAAGSRARVATAMAEATATVAPLVAVQAAMSTMELSLAYRAVWGEKKVAASAVGASISPGTPPELVTMPVKDTFVASADSSSAANGATAVLLAGPNGIVNIPICSSGGSENLSDAETSAAADERDEEEQGKAALCCSIDWRDVDMSWSPKDLLSAEPAAAAAASRLALAGRRDCKPVEGFPLPPPQAAYYAKEGLYAGVAPIAAVAGGNVGSEAWGNGDSGDTCNGGGVSSKSARKGNCRISEPPHSGSPISPSESGSTSSRKSPEEAGAIISGSRGGCSDSGSGVGCGDIRSTGDGGGSKGNSASLQGDGNQRGEGEKGRLPPAPATTLDADAVVGAKDLRRAYRAMWKESGKSTGSSTKRKKGPLNAAKAGLEPIHLPMPIVRSEAAAAAGAALWPPKVPPTVEDGDEAPEASNGFGARGSSGGGSVSGIGDSGGGSSSGSSSSGSSSGGSTAKGGGSSRVGSSDGVRKGEAAAVLVPATGFARADFLLPYGLLYEELLARYAEGRRASGRRSARDAKAEFVVIRHNIYEHRKQRTWGSAGDEHGVCSCVPSQRKAELGCRDGDGCSSRLSHCECDPSSCPLGNRCSNRALQQRGGKPLSGLTVRDCGNKGLGLFVTGNSEGAAILRGDLVGEFLGVVLPEAAYRESQEGLAGRERHRYAMLLEHREVLDASRKGSIMRFANHSCQPNCEAQRWLIGGEVRVGIFAKIDIWPGEEICFDYQYGCHAAGEEPRRCLCGASCCTGFLGTPAAKASSPLPPDV